MQRDLQFLLDMLQSTELVVTYTAQCTKDEFLNDVQLVQTARIRLITCSNATQC